MRDWPVLFAAFVFFSLLVGLPLTYFHYNEIPPARLDSSKIYKLESN